MPFVRAANFLLTRVVLTSNHDSVLDFVKVATYIFSGVVDDSKITQGPSPAWKSLMLMIFKEIYCNASLPISRDSEVHPKGTVVYVTRGRGW